MAHSRHTILILNSAQSRYPRGDDPWVEATVRAYARLAGGAATAITSTEPLMWDFGVFLAAEQGMNIRHIPPEYDPGRAEAMFGETVSAFGVDEGRAGPLYLKTQRGLSRGDVWRLRDITAIRAADVIYPVAIRPGGRLETMLQTEPLRAEVNNDFAIPWGTRIRRTPAYDFADAKLNPLPDGDWLVHWTRSSPGPWPGETAPEFFRDLLARPAVYVRSARETLVRILAKRVIRASSWKIPGQTPVVSLTENTPETAVTLMRWRKRFVRYTYEPYGVAIRREALARVGAKKVVYAVRAGDPGADAWKTQSPGVVSDWTREREWRHPGDVSLDALDPGDWFAIVPGQSDAAYLESALGADVRTFVLFVV